MSTLTKQVLAVVLIMAAATALPHLLAFGFAKLIAWSTESDCIPMLKATYSAGEFWVLQTVCWAFALAGAVEAVEEIEFRDLIS